MSMPSEGSPGELIATTELSHSERHRLLADERRRTVLAVLEARGATVPFEELAAAVEAHERGEHVAAGEASDAVRIALHHVHLPMLDEFGVLTYEPRTKRVEVRPTGTGVAPL